MAVGAEILRIKLPKIPGQADPLKIRMERPLRDERIRQGGEDLFRYFLSGSNVHHLDISVIYGVAEEKNTEVRGFGVLVDARAGQIYGTVGFDVDGEGAHGMGILLCGTNGLVESG